MSGVRLWLVALATLALLSLIVCHKTYHHRRSLTAQANLPVKGGWRPVVGSAGLQYGSLGNAPLHAPYRIPVEMYHSSSRPLAARDVTKLTSIAQSYRPTTLRTVPVTSHTLNPNQPINSYLNPFVLPNNGLLNQYKFVQNYPVDSMLIRNPYNAYAARPVVKAPPKQKQYHNNILQQLTSIQPTQFGQYSTITPTDIFGKIIDSPPKPDRKRQQSDTEIFKPEVFKLPDNDAASQFIAQTVKTVQQQTLGVPKLPVNQYGHPFQDNIYNFQQFPNIIGTFGSFGLQSVKGRDHLNTKTTYLPPQPTRQTVFNSFNYSPNFKSTPALFSPTTPKLPTTQNNVVFGSTFNDVGNIPTPKTKFVSSLKIDPNVGSKNYFKPSLQDPFVKNVHNLDFNKITTYNPPTVQTTTRASTLYNDYSFPSQNSQNYNHEIVNINYDKTKQKVSDNVGLTQQVSQQFADAPGLFDLQSTLNALSYRPTYAVVENVSEEENTHASPETWTVTPLSYGHNQGTEQAVTRPVHINNIFEKPTTSNPDLVEEFAIVTEGEKGYENALKYDSHIDTQGRRPLGDDFEPIGKTKLKDYYYKVSTPAYYNNKHYRRTKKPNDVPKPDVTLQTANKESNANVAEPLPTLPPSLHFKRPSASEPLEKDKIRKRNKIRRRRPVGNRNKEETSTQKLFSNTESTEAPTTVADEIYTIKPRVRPVKAKTEPSVTTPSITTDLTTSALPTTSPTKPTIVRKKLIGHRRPLTTLSDKPDTTTESIKEQDYSKESSIMKISSRPHSSRLPSNLNDYKSSEVPDYSHKQDEKDTPTSDVAVSLTDAANEFSFHRDARPVEMKETSTDSNKEIDATTLRSESNTRLVGKIQRPRLKNKLDRPKFSVKDYRNRLNSTTSTTEKITENTPKPRPQRKNPYSEVIFGDVETTTERKKFTPKEPRHKFNRTESNEHEIHSRLNGRQKPNPLNTDSEITTQKNTYRIRNGPRRPKPDETTETTGVTTAHNKRPLRKKFQDSVIGESVQDISVTETAEPRNEITSEKTRSESAIMKIADKKHQDHMERLFEHSKRVSDLTLAASKDYNTPGMFKTVSSNSRRIPSYFTIATDDPILPIEAFFPQLNQKKES